MKTRLWVSLVCAATMLVTTGARAVIPSSVETPILGAETKVGDLVVHDTQPVAPTPKTVDGNPADWTGDISRLSGTAIFSRGEYVYQDYIGDSWGADDGFDEQRVGRLDTLTHIEPRFYRLDPLQQAAGDQFGAPRPIGAALSYGDTTANDTERNASDIEEVRLAADASTVDLLVRTTGMTATVQPGVLVLIDSEPGGSYTLPKAMGGINTAAEWAFLAYDNQMLQAWFKGHEVTASGAAFAVSTDPSGYVNSTEISIARSFLESFGPVPSAPGIGVATGVVRDATAGLADVAPAGAASDLLNVAFRHEQARIWSDEAQAFALHDGSIDSFLKSINLDSLAGGRTQTFTQLPGFYDRIYVDDTTPVNDESMDGSYFQGIFQHYGLYLPGAYTPGRTLPATFWMHYRGGHANDAAAWEPGIMRQFGDGQGAIVVTPSARGTSSWYTGRGMVDFLDVWHDVFGHYAINADRVELAGHSMGGWASYLLGLLFPDKWSASNPEDGLLVPGLWLGTGQPSDPQNGADVNAEFLYPLIGNARNVPYAILHGVEDELVPVPSAIGSAARYQQLGYRYRLYLFYTYEHYSAPLWDDWRDIVRYLSTFRRPENPQHVTYSISPALDHAVSTISVPTNVDLHFTFNSAYWVSGLLTRKTGTDPSNIGTVDAVTFGRGVDNILGIPEAGTAGQTEVYTMTGQRWLRTGTQAAANRFTATLTNLSAITFDLARMGLSSGSTLQASVTLDGPTSFTLAGSWTALPTISVGGHTASFHASLAGGALTLTIDPGSSGGTALPIKIVP